MSLISWIAHCAAHPLMLDLNLRGRLENAASPMYWAPIASISGEASMISLASSPASGQPSITRGVSPQASVVDRPTPSRASQIAGTFSISIQCSWMFCRSVTSAVPRPYRRDMSAIVRQQHEMSQHADEARHEADAADSDAKDAAEQA